jgi:hypothetical protein
MTKQFFIFNKKSFKASNWFLPSSKYLNLMDVLSQGLLEGQNLDRGVNSNCGWVYMASTTTIASKQFSLKLKIRLKQL